MLFTSLVLLLLCLEFVPYFISLVKIVACRTFIQLINKINDSNKTEFVIPHPDSFQFLLFFL